MDIDWAPISKQIMLNSERQLYCQHKVNNYNRWLNGLEMGRQAGAKTYATILDDHVSMRFDNMKHCHIWAEQRRNVPFKETSPFQPMTVSSCLPGNMPIFNAITKQK